MVWEDAGVTPFLHPTAVPNWSTACLAPLVPLGICPLVELDHEDAMWIPTWKKKRNEACIFKVLNYVAKCICNLHEQLL